MGEIIKSQGEIDRRYFTEFCNATKKQENPRSSGLEIFYSVSDWTHTVVQTDVYDSCKDLESGFEESSSFVIRLIVSRNLMFHAT